MSALTKTDFHFPGQTGVYHGKVRDVYNIGGQQLVMVATDRISAFDVVLPEGIPYKGQVLNQIAAKFLDATADICPNWKQATPDPMVTAGVLCEGFPVEMIVRGYLCGSAWRAYKSGVREICGVKLPEGMRENERFPEPIITPTTKAEIGEHVCEPHRVPRRVEHRHGLLEQQREARSVEGIRHHVARVAEEGDPLLRGRQADAVQTGRGLLKRIEGDDLCLNAELAGNTPCVRAHPRVRVEHVDEDVAGPFRDDTGCELAPKVGAAQQDGVLQRDAIEPHRPEDRHAGALADR